MNRSTSSTRSAGGRGTADRQTRRALAGVPVAAVRRLGRVRGYETWWSYIPQHRPGSRIQQHDAIRPARERVRAALSEDREAQAGQIAGRGRHDREGEEDLREANRVMTENQLFLDPRPGRVRDPSPHELGFALNPRKVFNVCAGARLPPPESRNRGPLRRPRSRTVWWCGRCEIHRAGSLLRRARCAR